MSSEVELALLYNPPPDPRLKVQAVLEERMVCVGRREIIGDTDAPITFDALLELPIIFLRQGVAGRAITNDVGLLKKIEAKAKVQMNSVQAISGSLGAGLGCTIGTPLVMKEQLKSGELHARPIVEPELVRLLYVCELADRPPTFALEAVRDVVVSLIGEAVRSGRWEAKLIA
jgi:LysR family nitrogen assimilation transcriptional regulator